jgi:hypothetical protein
MGSPTQVRSKRGRRSSRSRAKLHDAPIAVAPESESREGRSMKISIAGNDVPSGLVSVDTHRFGDLTAGSAKLTYELTMATDRVLGDFQRYYDDFVADTKAHAAEDHEPIARELERLKFPSFPGLLMREPTLAAAFLADVAYDFLNAMLTGHAGARPRYFIRTVDHVVVDPKAVALTGLVFDHRRELLDQVIAKMPAGTVVPAEEAPGYLSNFELPDED